MKRLSYLKSHISFVRQLYSSVLDNCELKEDNYVDEEDIQYGLDDEEEDDDEDEEDFFPYAV